MNKEPEPLSEVELLKLQIMQLRRELMQKDEQILSRDIAEAHCLSLTDYGKTWQITDGRIEHIQRADPPKLPDEPIDTPQRVADEITSALAG